MRACPGEVVTTESLVVFEDVWYQYPSGITALRGISLEFRRGELVAIVGANGSGKTTLIKHLNGLLKPSRGRVLVFGVDTRKSSVARLARHVGLVFQNPLNQFFADTVWDEVAFALKNFEGRVNSEKILGVLRELGIDHLKDRSPFEASLGEQKRVALASILVYEPEILALDEPTAGLDYRSKMTLLSILLKLRREGRTVILVSHDLEFIARARIDRLIVLSEGKVVFDGNPREAFYNPELLVASCLIPPQIPRLFIRLGLDGSSTPLNEEEAYVDLRKLGVGVHVDRGG